MNLSQNTKLILFRYLSVFLTGCTVGRYVTNVTSSGPNKVAVEKCTTKAYGNFYWNEECSETTLTLQPSSGSK
jgi:outer membrane biogenesis lipoprotein LolB